MAKFYVGQRVTFQGLGRLPKKGRIVGPELPHPERASLFLVRWDGWHSPSLESANELEPVNILDQIEEALRPSIEVEVKRWGNSGLSGAQEHHDAVSQKAHGRGADVMGPSHQQECEL